jgi:alkanesulfonate monooxygenase SsuD/methylene tetrahydromethanopterin reductase-like flavin-dependent oxidoreductase (luciferase family)
MQFGTFYQLPCAPGQNPQQRYADTMRQIEHADALGIDVAWLAELHFYPSFSIMPSPLMVASAVAQRTQRIRLGIAVNLLPLHNPLRNAEDAATLDLLSDGRLEYGAGRGSIALHFAGYNVPLEESRARFHEALEVVTLAWIKERFSYSGTYFTYHDVQVVPKPLQQPHPPMRIACNSSDSFRIAGERGWRLFCSPVVVPMPRLLEDLATYRSLRQQHDLPLQGDEVALMTSVYVDPNMQQAREVPEPSLTRYFNVLRQMHIDHAGPPPKVVTPRMREMQARVQHITYDEVCNTFGVFGDPAYCIDRLQAFKEQFGINQLICWFNTGGQIPHDKVMQSMRLFADKVMPHLS